MIKYDLMITLLEVILNPEHLAGWNTGAYATNMYLAMDLQSILLNRKKNYHENYFIWSFKPLNTCAPGGCSACWMWGDEGWLGTHVSSCWCCSSSYSYSLYTPPYNPPPPPRYAGLQLLLLLLLHPSLPSSCCSRQDSGQALEGVCREVLVKYLGGSKYKNKMWWWNHSQDLRTTGRP